MRKQEQIITKQNISSKELLKNERKILQCWCLLPDSAYGFYDLIAFFQLAKESEIFFFDILHDLQGKGYVQRIDKNFKITLSARTEIANTWPPKVKSCKKIILYFNNCLLLKKEEKWEDKEIYIPFAESILNSFTEDHEELIKLSTNLAIIHGALNNNSKSIEYHLHSSVMAEKTNSPHLSQCYHNTAEAYYKVKNLKKSLDYSLRFIELTENTAKKSATDMQQLAYHSYNAALLYFDMVNFIKAKEYIDKVVLFDQHLLDEEHPDFIYDLKIQKRIHIAYTISSHFIKYKVWYLFGSLVLAFSLIMYLFLFFD